MFHVITGGSGSGKSAYAEDCIVKYHQEQSDMEHSDNSLFYIATMMPFGAEMEKKIQRHRDMRADKGFETIECFLELHQVVKSYDFSPVYEPLHSNKNPDVLLECMSNLVANEWFAYVQKKNSSNCFSQDHIALMIEKIWQGIELLLSNCNNLVIVTNEVCSECVKDSIEMDCYKQILAGVNRKMAAVADKVTEVVYGIPVQIKGSEP